MTLDANTSTALSALVVALIALGVAVAQAAQQYLVSGQLIRICDSVVYGKMPGQGRRIWQFSQFRFRIVYSIPQITLPSTLWLSTSSRTGFSESDLLQLPDLSLKDTTTGRHSIAGEASWVSFVRTVQYSCGQSLRYRMVSGDADRCPTDLSVVPTQLSMRDVVVTAIMAGMNVTKVSFQAQSLSMHGNAGTITSSKHPVLGALIHFTPRAPFQSYGLKIGFGIVSAEWVVRMSDILAVAGRQYDLRERKHFEEDEGSWMTSSSSRSLILLQQDEITDLSSGRELITKQDTPNLEKRQQHYTPQRSRLAKLASSNDRIYPVTELFRRPQDGEWAFDNTGVVENYDKTDDRADRSQQRGSLQTKWTHRLLRPFRLSRVQKSLELELPIFAIQATSPQVAVANLRHSDEDKKHTSKDLQLTDFTQEPLSLCDQTPSRRQVLRQFIADRRRAERSSEGKRLSQESKPLLLMGEEDQKEEQEKIKPIMEKALNASLSNDQSSERATFVVEKWKRVFERRQRQRSRGVSQRAIYQRTRNADPFDLGGPSFQSNTNLSAGRETEDHMSKLAIAARRRSLSRDTQHDDSPNKNQMARRGRRRNSSFTRERTVSIEKRPHDDSPDENQFVKRGRRRNSSFARERALSAEKSSFSYGSKPIQRQEVSKSDSPFQSPEEQHSTRRVRMISCDTEDISSEERKASPRRVIPATNPPKGILRKPRETFPEEPVVIREGVAPILAAGKKVFLEMPGGPRLIVELSFLRPWSWVVNASKKERIMSSCFGY